MNIEPDMTVLDIISAHRQTEAVFCSYDAAAGECICCNALFETLKEMAARYSLDLEKLLADLRSSVKNPFSEKPL
ncbi:MAG: DUF1858 domain-containing protein [Desulfohalobiaceae bacterium]|nr:DUF1858 domain-containing protein [Desulfohalobiaceae bacterium]